MSVTEAPLEPKAKPVFGKITRATLQQDEALTRKVMGVVRDACKRKSQGMSVDEVARGLVDGSLDLWGVVSAGAVDAIVVTQTKDGVFSVLVAGPAFEDVAPFLAFLKQVAKSAHCERMTLIGPPFFRKHLAPGWFEREVRFECLLGDAG